MSLEKLFEQIKTLSPDDERVLRILAQMEQEGFLQIVNGNIILK
jgi:hypothetical protein